MLPRVLEQLHMEYGYCSRDFANFFGWSHTRVLTKHEVFMCNHGKRLRSDPLFIFEEHRLPRGPRGFKGNVGRSIYYNIFASKLILSTYTIDPARALLEVIYRFEHERLGVVYGPGYLHSESQVN